ncbi:hypothetical protein Alsa2_CDS0084 [Staphylococcus phage Alsa_2]|nr:hypothetical protein Alsa2_CDS0084 [Staphylococcus phage Alsa_2]
MLITLYQVLFNLSTTILNLVVYLYTSLNPLTDYILSIIN